MNTFELSIVTVETEIFSGVATKLFVTGIEGELEIRYGHAPLLTSLAPGPLWFEDVDGREEVLVVFGVMLEVQPKRTIILGDSAIQCEEMNEQAVKLAISQAEQSMSGGGDGKIDYTKAHSELMLALAQLRVIRKLRG